MSKRLLRTGDIINIKPGMRIYATIPRHFLYVNATGDWDIGTGEVTVGNRGTDFLAGHYVVDHVSKDGGGDDHPDGHHVHCIKVHRRNLSKLAQGDEAVGIEISFYQTGYFTCMIKDISPIGLMEKKWS